MLKKAEIWDTLIPWLIALGVLGLAIFLYIILANKAGSALDFLRTMFRFGR